MDAHYLINDQPTTCGICGVRTEPVADFNHTNKQYLVSECLNIKCKHIYLEVED